MTPPDEKERSLRVVCRWAVAPLKAEPRGRAEMISQALFGEEAELLEEITPPPASRERGWLRVRLPRDGYEGYAPREAFAQAAGAPTHIVAVPQTLLFPQPDIKTSPTQPLYMGALLRAAGEEGRFLRLADGGFVIAAHARPLNAPPEPDAAAVAQRMLHAPYLWGGRTIAGIDCSGLVQLALMMAGVEGVPRDSGPQSQHVGKALPLDWLREPERLRRGDLVFWKGHVAMLLDERTIIHANAHHMMVATEPLARAIARIAEQGSDPVALRRP
jgi:cell wall-associated NlpC family hydrolase